LRTDNEDYGYEDDSYDITDRAAPGDDDKAGYDNDDDYYGKRIQVSAVARRHRSVDRWTISVIN